MSEMGGGPVNRRTALEGAAAVAAGSVALAQTTKMGWAHDLRPTDTAYPFDEYERVVNRDVTVRMLFEWPTLNNPIIYNNISNALNGFQFSYDIPADQVQLVVQAYASANLAMYDDTLCAKYRLGDISRSRILRPARRPFAMSGSPATTQRWPNRRRTARIRTTPTSVSRDPSPEASCS